MPSNQLVNVHCFFLSPLLEATFKEPALVDAFKEVALLFFWTLQLQENSEPVMTRRQQSVSDSVFPTHREFDTRVTC